MHKDISVAIVCTSLNQMGGKTVHFKNMYLCLKNKGIDVTIVISTSLEREYRNFMKQEGVAEKDLVFISRSKKWLILPFLLDLRKAFIERRINIIHTFQLQSDFFGSIAASWAGIGSVISQQESKMIEEVLPFYKKLFYWSCNIFLRDYFKKTVVVSQALKEEAVTKWYRPENKIEIIPLGIDLPKEYRDRSFSFQGLKTRKPVIGTVARLNKEKGIDRFINAIPYMIESLPEAKFVIVGKGDQKELLKDMAKRLNLESRIEFKDLPWTETVYRTLEKMDIFVMPSLREGCPIGLLEAMGSSRPVVASKIEGISEIIEDGKNGLLVDTSDYKSFAEKVLYFCNNPESAIFMAEEGRKRILNSYTMDAEMERYRKLYQETLSQKLKRGHNGNQEQENSGYRG